MIIGIIKGDTRSLDHGSLEVKSKLLQWGGYIGFRVWGLNLNPQHRAEQWPLGVFNGFWAIVSRTFRLQLTPGFKF